jgi:hypothetical protein
MGQNPFRDFEAEIFELTTGSRVASITGSTREDSEPFKIGDLMSFNDSLLYQNNSKRARRCSVQRIEHEPNSANYKVYILAIGEETRKNYSRDRTTDWSGSDGWLRPN